VLQQVCPELNCISSERGGASGGGGVALRQPPQKKGLRNTPPSRLVSGPPNFMLLNVPDTTVGPHRIEAEMTNGLSEDCVQRLIDEVCFDKLDPGQ